MSKPELPLAPVDKTLSEHKSDFTAEGSPLPGKVSTSIPAGSPDAQPAQVPSATQRTTITLKRGPPSGDPVGWVGPRDPR